MCYTKGDCEGQHLCSLCDKLIALNLKKQNLEIQAGELSQWDDFHVSLKNDRFDFVTIAWMTKSYVTRGQSH